MVAAVLRGALVREGLVKTDVVLVEIVAPNVDNKIRGFAQIAQESGNGDVQHVVAKAAPVGPAAGDGSANVERMTRGLAPSTSPPKMLRREKPGSSGFVG